MKTLEKKEEITKDQLNKRSYKEQALKLVRDCCEELRELSFGCEVQTWIYPVYPLTFTVVEKVYKSGVIHCRSEDEQVWIKEEDLEIIGHPPQLQHWLRLLGDAFIPRRHNYIMFLDGGVAKFVDGCTGKTESLLKFNLTTGQPATEEDYQAIVDICS